VLFGDQRSVPVQKNGSVHLGDSGFFSGRMELNFLADRAELMNLKFPAIYRGATKQTIN
jgi:hypothetical protein